MRYEPRLKRTLCASVRCASWGRQSVSGMVGKKLQRSNSSMPSDSIMISTSPTRTMWLAIHLSGSATVAGMISSPAMAGVTFNPMDPAFVADPYPTYRQLRTEDPVHHSPMGFWVLTRYEDVVAALRDPRLAKEAIAAFVAARFGAPVPITGLSMLDRDPPDHTRLRSLVSKAFTPRVVEGLRPRVQQIVDGLIARAREKGSMDLIEEFAYPIPVNVICEMLGVPVEDHERFKGWSLDIARGLDSILLPPDSEVPKRSVASRTALAEYFRELIAKRRASPRADLLSGLIAAEEAGDKLSENELLATCILLLIAGHETTVNLIGNGTCWWDDVVVEPEQKLVARIDLASAIVSPAIGGLPVMILNRARERGPLRVRVTAGKTVATADASLTGEPTQRVEVPIELAQRGKVAVEAALLREGRDEPLYVEKRDVTIPPPLVLLPPLPTHWAVEDGPAKIELTTEVAV